MESTIQEYIDLLRKVKQLDENRKVLKEKMKEKSESIQKYLENNRMKSVSFGSCVIKLKTTRSKPSLNEAFLTETLNRKVAPEATAELVSFILAEQDGHKTEKTTVEVRLGSNHHINVNSSGSRS